MKTVIAVWQVANRNAESLVREIGDDDDGELAFIECVSARMPPAEICRKLEGLMNDPERGYCQTKYPVERPAPVLDEPSVSRPNLVSGESLVIQAEAVESMYWGLRRLAKLAGKPGQWLELSLRFLPGQDGAVSVSGVSVKEK